MPLSDARQPTGKTRKPSGHVRASEPTPDNDQTSLIERFVAARKLTESLAEPLETEDFVVSTMNDVSPAKWHLAHTAWFFETFILAPHVQGYEPFNPAYVELFDPDKVEPGERQSRSQRGLATRPTVREVFEYRAHVDEHMHRLIDSVAGDATHPASALIDLALHHEQQHQEQLLADIKHVFWTNPLRPVYVRRFAEPAAAVPPLAWDSVGEGTYSIGHDANSFAFANERPRHRVQVPAFKLATRLITNGEYLEFVLDSGYRRAEFWHPVGFAAVGVQRWRAPLYWEGAGNNWMEFSLAGGLRELDLAEPVTHVSWFEADAYARWSKKHLPTEAEWEVAARSSAIVGTFIESQRFHPAPAADADGDNLRPMESPLVQLYGDVWQWTQSPHVDYPGYHPPQTAIGEYNGKWPPNHMVLRGASCATPRSNARLSYRHFLACEARWQFTGIRLADTA